MDLANIIFYLLSAITIGAAIMVLISKNPVHSVLWLIVVFFAISAHYIMLNAQFLAIVNIIVYAGAIMVLFLFVIMLMNLGKETEPQKNIWVKIAGVSGGGCLFIVMILILLPQAKELEGQQSLLNSGNIGLVKTLGKVLYSDYVLPFEISSVLFLSAMVGAVVIGKK
jgi:NADH-quinone oxidoreductase subunit J